MKKTAFILILLSSSAMATEPLDLAYSSNDYGNGTSAPVIASVPPAPQTDIIPASAVQPTPPSAKQQGQGDSHKTDMTLSDFF